MRYGAWAALLIGSLAHLGVIAATQQPQASTQEGVQPQGNANRSAAERAAATRTFLGLGATPDRAAAARGAPLFARICGFCHGQTARGATGPSLITSDRVLEDDHGEHLSVFLRKGSPDKGMPPFAAMEDKQLTDIAEFLHLQVEEVANRGTYQVLNIVVGNAAKGKIYVETRCMSCHNEKDFAHLASRVRSPEQLQRYWVWPARDGKITADVKTPDGTISGRLEGISDFRVTVVDAAGATRTIDRKPGIDVQIHDSLAAHQKLVKTLANGDMHDVTAYLETLK